MESFALEEEVSILLDLFEGETSLSHFLGTLAEALAETAHWNSDHHSEAATEEVFAQVAAWSSFDWTAASETQAAVRRDARTSK